jgi:hypothetical protein
VTGRGDEAEWSTDPKTLIAQIKAVAERMDVDDLRDLNQQLLLAGADLSRLARPVRASRRRPRRAKIQRYRIRVDIAGARPPIWRRLEVSSQLMLDDLHQVIQAAFGWTDSHLHRFGAGGSVWDPRTELYLCPFDLEEGEDEGVPEDRVRLDEVLVDVGDSLHYVYDYGDDWEHRIKLEGVLEWPPGAPLVTCVGGRRAGPPEDCGGIHGYEEMLANAADPGSDAHDDALDSMLHYLGTRDFDPAQFDLDEVNAALSGVVDPALQRHTKRRN